MAGDELDTERPAPPTQARPVRTALWLFTVSWCVTALVGGYAFLTMESFHPVLVPGFDPVTGSGAARALLDPWQSWDGQWYLKIAAAGYAPDGSPAFFPLYPLLIRATAPALGGNPLAAALLWSWMALAGALVVLTLLLRSDFGDDETVTSLVLLLAFPTAFTFHAAYTESLFLLLSASAFLAARRGRWLAAGAFGLLAALTRSAGFLIVPALLIEGWSQTCRKEGAETSGWGGLVTREGFKAFAGMPALRFAGSLLPLVALPVLLVLFQKSVGDAWAFREAQKIWERHPAAPWTAIADGVRVLLPGSPGMLDPLPGGAPRLSHYAGGFLESNVYNLVAAIGGLALAAVALRRLRPSYGLFALAGVLLPLMTPSRVLPLYSMPRFIGVLFPLFVAAAVLLRRRPLLRAGVIAGAAALQGLFIARFVLWYWVA
jgi:hypothetical protein